MRFEELRYYFSKDDFFRLLRVAIIVVGGLFLIASPFLAVCAKNEIKDAIRYPSQAKIERQFKDELPVGSDAATVLAFLDRHKIGHGNYHQVTEYEKKHSQEFRDFTEPKLKSKVAQVKYRIYLGSNVSNWQWSAACWAHIWFYFDENGKLIEPSWMGFVMARSTPHYW